MVAMPKRTPPARLAFRAMQYRHLSEARKQAGKPPLTLEEMNKMTRWQIIEETNACLRMTKQTGVLFEDRGSG